MKIFKEDILKILHIFDLSFLSFIPLVSLFLFLGLVDVLSLGMIIPYVTLLLDQDSKILNEIFQFIPNINFESETKNFFISFSLFFILIFFFRTILAIGIRAYISKFSHGRLYKLQVKLFSIYQNMLYSDFKKKNQSEYIRNIRELSASSSSCLESGLKLTSEIIIIISIFIFLIFIEPLPVLSVSLILILCLITYNKIFKKKVVKYGEIKLKSLKDIYQVILESFKGFKEINTINKKSFFGGYLKKNFQEVYRNDLKSSIIILSPRYIFEFIIVIFLITYLLFQIITIESDSNILAMLGVYTLAGLRILPSTSVISNCLVMIGYNTQSFRELYIDIKKSNEEKKEIELETLNNEQKFNSIELKNIEFKYENSKIILQDINLKIEKFQTIGLIGKTGSGKSTLVDIMLGFLVPTKGAVLVNGKKSTLKNFFNRNVYYLPQDHLLISNTIEKNICLSDGLIDRKKIDEAINKSDLTDFVKTLPQGINTKIGPYGINLSGGQMKKISLARMFYHDKNFIIFDEVTTALDKKAEDKIIEEIKKMKKTKTMILISHDHHNLRYCDKIYKIENNKINEISSF
jgi:ABC-type bacteriocin/lantibiotic exporter with double-glycine peptidase domain